MEDISKVFENEKLLEKVAAAETREDAKKVCKEEGLEVTDADLDAIAGGLRTREQKIGDNAIKEIRNNAIKRANRIRDDRKKFRQSIAGEVKNYGEIFDVPYSSSGGSTDALLASMSWWKF